MVDFKTNTHRKTLKRDPNLHQKIRQLAKEKNALILAHYYQTEDIQQVADFVGDSLGLAKKARDANHDIIVFSGVKFMAETAKILNPTKMVLLPDMMAGCSLADNCPADKFKDFIEAHPDHYVITYVNTSAEIKAMSDMICTSSNAEEIVAQVPENQKIIFAPDANLGKYIMKQTKREMVLWDGFCVVHEAVSIDKLLELMKEYPGAKLIAHPESEDYILRIAHFVGSTGKMINHVKQSQDDTFIVATEAGILYKMQQEAPNKNLIPAPAHEDNTCACSECSYMKVNTLEKLYQCLIDETPSIEMEEDLIKKATLPLERMFELS